MLLLFVSAILLAYWIIVQSIRKRELNAKLKHFPGTNLDYPILGDVPVWSIAKWSIHEKMKYFVNLIRDYSTTFKVWVGPIPLVVINNPDDIKTILTSSHCVNKSSIYRIAIGGEGILVANDDKWRNQRRHLNTSFNPRVINSYAKEFNRFGRNNVAAFEEHAIGGKEFDVSSTIGINVTDLITRTIYGSTHQKLESSKYCFEIVERLMEFWCNQFVQIYFQIYLILFRKLFGGESEDNKLNKELREELQPILNQKIEEYQNKIKNYESDDNGDTESAKDEHFLEKLTRLRFDGTIGVVQYRHTSRTMFLAAIETTTRSISNVILMLALYQEHQEKVYEEVCHFFELHGDDDIDLSKLYELKLLDQFIKETFRLYPFASMLGRTPSRDIPLKEGILPAGIDIVIPVINLHQRTDIWGKDAMKFNPDHFLPEAVANRNACTYIPFSYGSRNCIGYKFAQISMCMGLAYLIKNYKFETTLKVDDIVVGYGVTTYVKNDNLVRVHSRNLKN